MTISVRKVIESLQGLDPDDEIIIMWYDRRDVESTIFGGDFRPFEVKNEHWQEIKNRFREDHPYESFCEEFTDRVRQVIGDFECEECQTLDYELKPIGETGENVCRKCSEAEDEIY
jgi:hypothetical protein